MFLHGFLNVNDETIILDDWAGQATIKSLNLKIKILLKEIQTLQKFTLYSTFIFSF